MRRLVAVLLPLALGLGCSSDPREIPPINLNRADGAAQGSDAGDDAASPSTDDAAAPSTDDATAPSTDDAAAPSTDDAAAPSTDDAAAPGDDAAPSDDAASGADDAASSTGDAASASPDASSGSPDATVVPDSGPSMAADLVARFTMPPPAAISAGGNLALGLEVQNIGSQSTPPTEVLIDIRRAGTPVAQATRLAQVGVRSLNTGGTETLTLTLVLPAALSPGSYTVRAFVDPGLFIAEATEANNTAEATTGVALSLEANPASLSLGPVATGCAAGGGAVTLTNTGRTNATIDGATLIGTTELSIAGLMLPQTLLPNGTLGLTIQYTPIDVGVDMARLELAYDQGGRATLALPITAEGRVAATRTDVFQQAPTQARLDLLMMVDDSGSMTEEQTNLSGQSSAFLAWAQANSVDYRIAVVTTDMDAAGRSGRFFGNPLIISNATPNAAAALAANTRPGINGSGDERGLEAIVAALTPPLSNGTNAGFLRADAALGVLILSDEEDFSTNTTAMAVAAQLQALKPNGQIRVNSIVTPINGCPTGASPGARYIALSSAFMGTVESICAASWTASLTSWGNIAGPRRSFALSRPARAAGVTVRVNAMSVASGPNSWTFDAPTNSVVFAPAGTPANGATIEVAYTEGCSKPARLPMAGRCQTS